MSRKDVLLVSYSIWLERDERSGGFADDDIPIQTTEVDFSHTGTSRKDALKSILKGDGDMMIDFRIQT